MLIGLFFRVHTKGLPPFLTLPPEPQHPFCFPQWRGMLSAVLQVQLVLVEQIYLFFLFPSKRNTIRSCLQLCSWVISSFWALETTCRGLETQQDLMIREMVSGLEDLGLVAWDELLSPCHSLVSDVGRRRTQLNSKAQVMMYPLLYHTVCLNKHTWMILWEVMWSLMVYFHLWNQGQIVYGGQHQTPESSVNSVTQKASLCWSLLFLELL